MVRGSVVFAEKQALWCPWSRQTKEERPEGRGQAIKGCETKAEQGLYWGQEGTVNSMRSLRGQVISVFPLR